MKRVAVALDKWKLPIFKRHLEGGGFKFKKFPGLTEDMLILKVQTESIASLQKVVEAAQKEASSQ